MRHLLAGVLLVPVLASAEPVKIEKPVLCDNSRTVFKAFSEGEWKERPFWIGNGHNSKFTLLVNEETKTWTLIQFNEDIACILGTGENYRQVFLGPKT